ncbi:fibronectin type III domain-containing protein [Terrihalobacillus insolitus]|uniref:fibronectin type III domain-containing protein n=1 Tax=Terrihalobacillus insolitus TaxID=2950438 RepID=UPI003A9552C8
MNLTQDLLLEQHGSTQFMYLLPKEPANLVSSNITSTSFDVAWDVVEDSSGYEVYLDGILEATVDVANYSVTGLTTATTYDVNVVALNSKYGTESAQSETLTVTTA